MPSYTKTLKESKVPKKRQPINHYTCYAIVKGHREDSLERVYEKSAPRSRKTINPRTGNFWTIFKDKEGPVGRANDFVMQFKVVREAVRGNHENDVREFISYAAAKMNIRVEIEIHHDRTKRFAL